MDGWIESRHRCVNGSHTRPRCHEAFLPVDPKLDKAEGGDPGDKPPAICQLIVLKYDEVLLYAVFDETYGHGSTS